MLFCIPVLPESKASNWELIGTLLNGTLKSIANQSLSRSQVIIAAHTLPPNFDPQGLDITVLQAKWDVNKIAHLPFRDKSRKKYLLGAEVFRRGGGYTMLLDADDRIHRSFVEYVYNENNPNGYIVERGYAYDYLNRIVAPIPGAWPKPFHFYCGSCTVLNLQRNEAEATSDSSIPGWEHAQSLLTINHPKWKEDGKKRGLPFHEFPFHAAMYFQNTSENSHVKIDGKRRSEVEENIEKHQIPLTQEIVDDFAL